MATTPEEISQFHAQKDCMSAVYDRILVLVEGMSILREMGSKPDPQKIFEKLLYTATNSTGLRLKASSLMPTFSKIENGDGSFEPGAKVSSSMSIIFSSNSTR